MIHGDSSAVLIFYLYIYISDWICKSMAIEISLIYLLTESCSGACFFSSLTFYLANLYRLFTE